MEPNLESYMMEALGQARQSLRQGNHGFGAVIVRDGQILCRAHDTEETEADPTAHAEMNAIRAACRILGRDLSGCLIVSTHEPCPMCATAMVWSGIRSMAYGYSIADALKQGRRRIDLDCAEVFRRAGADMRVDAGVLRDECALLYRKDVRREVKRLRGATDADLKAMNQAQGDKRVAWFTAERPDLDRFGSDPLERAHGLLAMKFGASRDEMEVKERGPERIVFHSKNFCPTLEACRILDLDTRHVCRLLNEDATDRLVKCLDPRLTFTRNYDKLRPHAPYCEEMIILRKGGRQ